MRPSRRVVFQTISIVVVAILVLIALLSLYVYKESVGKFEIRRLSLPTRVYADYTLLHTGVVISPDDLLEKLDRLGYRQVASVNQSGEYSAKRGEVYLTAGGSQLPQLRDDRSSKRKERKKVRGEGKQHGQATSAQ